MTTYTLSIEDRVGTGVLCTERAVTVSGSLADERKYNPNATTKPFNSKDNEFDTPFCIVHPFRNVAKLVAKHYFENGGSSIPQIKYDVSVNDAQQRLFENVLKQEAYNFLYGSEEAGARRLLETLPEDRVLERVGLQGKLAALEEKKQQILSLP